MNENEKIIAELEKKRDKLIDDVNALNKTIDLLRGSVPASFVNETSEVYGKPKQESKPMLYDSSWSLLNKFKFLLKTENRFLHFREAAEKIVEVEGLDKTETPPIARKLSSSTNKIKKDGTLVKYKATNRHTDTFWGSPKWLGTDGKPLKGHEPNKKYIGGNTDPTMFDI